MEKRIEVKLKFSEGEVVLEGPEDFVERQLDRLSGAPSTVLGPQVIEPAEMNPAMIREFVQAKKPKGHHEVIATAAFWLKEQGQSEFTAEDIRRCYIRAGERLPKVIDQALRDTKNKFDYVEPAGDKGSYQLTDHGYNVVRFDLPRKGGKQ